MSLETVYPNLSLATYYLSQNGMKEQTPAASGYADTSGFLSMVNDIVDTEPKEPSEVVSKAADAHKDLLNQINQAADIVERITGILELRDILTEALISNGYTATGNNLAPDQLNVDGTEYEVIANAWSLTSPAAVQFSPVVPIEETRTSCSHSGVSETSTHGHTDSSAGSSCSHEGLAESSCSHVGLEASSCNHGGLTESSCNHDGLTRTSCGHVGLEPSTCGHDGLTRTSCGHVGLEPSTCGHDGLTRTSCGHVGLEPSTCSHDGLTRTSCGHVGLEPSTCSHDGLTRTSCGHVGLEEPSTCSHDGLTRTSCGHVGLEQSSSSHAGLDSAPGHDTAE